MLVADGCRYMVNNAWFKSGDTVQVEEGVSSPNLVALPAKKVRRKAPAKKAEVEL